MTEIIAIRYDVEATVRFKDVTWVTWEERHEPLLNELAGLKVADATREMLEDDLAFLAKPPELGGFTVEVSISNPVDVTEELADEIKAED